MEAEAFMESNPDILKKGYFLPGSNGFLVICVHGFGGSPAEHYFTAKALNEAGYAVSVPLLKGHGTRIEDLDVCHYQDWIDSLEEEYQKRKTDYQGVYFLGLSMGGLLSLYMAEHHPEIKAVSLLAPALIYKQKSTYAAWLLLPFKKHLPFSNSFPNMPKENRPYLAAGYGASSVPAALQMTKLQKIVKKDLKAIHQPVILFQSKADTMVDPKTEAYILNHISSVEKQGTMFEQSSHVITLDSDKDKAFQETLAFFAQHR
jgi:carboxylesterase